MLGYRHNAHLTQYAKVFRDGGLRNSKCLDDISDRVFPAVHEHVDDLPSSRLRNRVEYVGRRGRAWH
jgi:hypothetical protein